MNVSSCGCRSYRSCTSPCPPPLPDLLLKTERLVQVTRITGALSINIAPNFVNAQQVLAAKAIIVRVNTEFNRTPTATAREDADMTTSERFRQRRLLLTAGASYAICSMLGLSARAGPAQNILSIVYSGSLGLDPNVRNLAHNLQASGATVTSYWGPFPGDLAALLAQNSFDQIYIWDLESAAPVMNAADKAALAAWWNGSSAHRNIVLDSRSSGIFVENDSSEQNYCKNMVANFAARGGGLWIGAKYAPIGARTANAYLDSLVSDSNQPLPEHFQGEYGNISAVAGNNNPLLTTPNVIDASGLAWSILGTFGRSEAPASAPGIGPLATVATDAEGHRLITTNIPESTGFMGLGAGGAALFAARRRTETRRGD